MAELLDDPDNEVKSLKHGDVVEGTVVRIDPDEILVDFGGKSEGVVSNRELMGRRGPREADESRPELKVGDEVLVYVLQPESPEGHAVLSLRRAGLERKWRAMQERFDAGEIVEARVIDHNKGGLIVDLGVRGFVPISQIVDFPRRPRDEQPRDAAQEIAEKLQPFVGRTLRLKILEVNRKANRLILSEKVALYEERREKRDELFSSLQVGQRVTGVVRSIAPFGVFIDLGGIDGLVHKSELSWNKVNNPETAYAIGEEVEAEVIDINHERGRISLSIRRLQPDPWQESVAKYQIGDVIEGTVTKLVNFGAFVRVEEGLEGLIHISELSNQRVAHPGRRGEGGRGAEAQDHQPRLRAPSAGPQPQAGRGAIGAGARRAAPGALRPGVSRIGRRAASAVAATVGTATTVRRTRSASRTRGSTTPWPPPSRHRACSTSSGRSPRRQRRRSRSGRVPRQPPRSPPPSSRSRGAAEEAVAEEPVAIEVDAAAEAGRGARRRGRAGGAAAEAEAPAAEAEAPKPMRPRSRQPKPSRPRPSRRDRAEADRSEAEAEAEAEPAEGAKA